MMSIMVFAIYFYFVVHLERILCKEKYGMLKPFDTNIFRPTVKPLRANTSLELAWELLPLTTCSSKTTHTRLIKYL
jgi:hypothetical protein